MRSAKSVFYKAIGALVLSSLWSMPSWQDRVEEKLKRFQQLMLLAENGNGAACRELDKEAWHAFVKNHCTPKQRAAFAACTEAREFYAYADRLQHYYGLYHDKQTVIDKRLDALKDIFVIVTKIFSQASQRRFKQEFGETPESISRKLVQFFEKEWRSRQKAAPKSVAARQELVKLYALATSQAYTALDLAVCTPEEYNAWLVKTVAPHKLEPREFVGNYLPRLTRATVNHYSNNAIQKQDRTLAVWVYCYLRFMDWPTPPELQAFIAQAS